MAREFSPNQSFAPNPPVQAGPKARGLLAQVSEAPDSPASGMVSLMKVESSAKCLVTQLWRRRERAWPKKMQIKDNWFVGPKLGKV